MKIMRFKQTRTKLWELEHNYHCAVIGTCLTMDEVKKLLRLLHVNVSDLCAYEIHVTIVSLISYHDFGSKKVQNYLDKKFKTAIQKTKGMDANELLLEWKRVLDTGAVIGVFWAIISHPRTDKAMKRNIYGDIHMQSHMSGASHRVDIKRLKQLENEHKEFNTGIRQQQAKYQKLQSENIRLQGKTQNQVEKNTGLNNQIATLTNANEQLTIVASVEKYKQLDLQVKKLHHKTDFQQNEIKAYYQQQLKLDKLVLELTSQIHSHEKTITTYKNETEHLQSLLNQNQLAKECRLNKQNLCGQCILYVGGKANLIAHYRDLVEARAGVFLHHDGGIEKNTQDLAQSLNRADLVIFPSDCISHDAYWKIKRVCKKQQKPYEYLKSPGLHSLSSVLDAIVINNKEIGLTQVN